MNGMQCLTGHELLQPLRWLANSVTHWELFIERMAIHRGPEVRIDKGRTVMAVLSWHG